MVCATFECIVAESGINGPRRRSFQRWDVQRLRRSLAPGAVAREDTHYERNGEQKIHLATEPLTGWVTVDVTEKRRTCEWIDQMVEISENHPDAECIRVVIDSLSTHNPAAFYRVFTPDVAREYLDRFEFYFTPTHGSWLNMAEIELSALKN